VRLSIEITLLQLLKYRDRYERLARRVPKSSIEFKSSILLSDFGAFFKEFPDVQRIEFESFMLWFKAFQHPTLNAEQAALYTALLTPVLTKECEPALEFGIMGRLEAAETASNVATILTKYNEGVEIDLYKSLREEMDRYESANAHKVLVPWVSEDIDDILKESINDSGLRWRLPCFNAVMRPLRGGDFVIYAGRIGKGKTTGVASEVTFMAPQFDEYYGPDHGRYATWMCNEGPGKRIVSRVYQSALNINELDLIRMSQDGTLKPAYAKAVGASDRIRVMNVHGLDNYEVENILKRVKPGLIIFDMIDNIRFSGKTNNGGERTDEVLESMYQWGRLLGVEYDCPVIATSQTSGDAAPLTYPKAEMLKDSKTGKQGAADLMIMMGSHDDYPNSRFISIPKTKLARPGAPAWPRWELQFDGERGRISEPSEVS
jgi:replicative DNA helicase